MGVSISWRPVSQKTTNITPGARSAFMEMLEEAFGRFPIHLDDSNLTSLRMMRLGAAGTGHSEIAQSLQSLIDAIEKHEEIEVMASY